MINISVRNVGAVIAKLILDRFDKSILYNFFKSLGDSVNSISSDVDTLKADMESVKSGATLEYINDEDIKSLF